DGQNFINEQNVGPGVHGDRKAQPREHPAAVGLHGSVDELADLAELDDLLESLARLLLAVAEDSACHANVLASREYRVEPSAERDQRSYRSVYRHLPGRGFDQPIDQL